MKTNQQRKATVKLRFTEEGLAISVTMHTCFKLLGCKQKWIHMIIIQFIHFKMQHWAK